MMTMMGEEGEEDDDCARSMREYTGTVEREFALLA